MLTIIDSKKITGPMGKFEDERFSHGTKSIANAIGSATRKSAITIACGGDTIAAIEKFSAKNEFSHLSMGGAAALEMLSGKDLPGVRVLSDSIV